MNHSLSEIPDNLVAIWNYSQWTLSTIKERSGKFWMLEIISKNPELVGKLKKLWVIVWSTNPTILLSHEDPDDEFFIRLQWNISRFPKELLNYIKRGTYHIRGWSPWDMKWLVDVMRTPIIQGMPSRDIIIWAIEKIRHWAMNQTQEIGHYAQNEWVYWNPENIQIWVVPTLVLPIVTVTEDPNRDDRLFIDTLHSNKDGDRIMRRVEYTETSTTKEVKPMTDIDPNDMSPKANLARMFCKMDEAFWRLDEAKNAFDERNSSPEWKNIAQIISLLKVEGMLDPNMTYQFEFGWIEETPSKFILFQIKEFAKKNPINTDTLINEKVLPRNMYGSSVTRIITGLTEWEEINVPIIDGNYRWNIWEGVRNQDYSSSFAARPAKNSDDLCASDYHKDLQIFFHGDAHGWTLAHNSFRFAQSVVRKWWSIILWDENRFNDHSPKKIWLKVQDGVLRLLGWRDIKVDLANLELPPFPEIRKRAFTPKR